MKNKILVVDDESRMRKLVKDFLVRRDFEVLEAGDGEEAVDIFFQEKDIALIILDVMMPKMDGWEVCRTIRKHSQVPIIMLTAKGEELDELLGFELGVDDYVLKPYEKERIRKVLSRCLSSDAPDEKREKPHPKKIAINTEGKTIFENAKDLVFLETCRRGCLIHAAGREYYDSRGIGDFEKRLESLENVSFFRCHKSYLINLEKVKEVFPWGNNSLGLKMEGYEGTVIPVGREKTKILRSRMGW